MKFAIMRHGSHPVRDQIADAVIDTFLRHGHQLCNDTRGINFMLNLTDVHSPRAARRQAQSVFIVSLVVAEAQPDDMRSLCYQTLIRTLSNLLICLIPTHGYRTAGQVWPEVFFTTPEAGFYHLPFDPEAVYRCMLPICGAHYAIENRVSPDLPEHLWSPSPVVQQISAYGRELDRLGVLPTPFPLRQLLTAADVRHIYKIYGVTGLSYGNLSAREDVPELGQTTFWMTGRGVDKAHLAQVGKDVLLVKEFDDEQGEALLSVPPAYAPQARVSVDAVEHALIYRTFPDVGAIVHVHAWLEPVLCTKQNYPCGTRELAEEVVALLKQTAHPSCTAVGLKNHGLTITGPSLEEIFRRLRGRLLTEVPMFA